MPPPIALAAFVPVLVVVAPLLFRWARGRWRRAAATPRPKPALGPAAASSEAAPFRGRLVADATHHVTPFDALEVPINGAALPLPLSGWVDPIYLDLEHPDLVPFLRAQWPLFTDDNLTTMLGDGDWRTRVAAARLAAITGRSTLAPLLGRLLLRSDVVFAGRDYCYALATFDAPDGVGCIEQYLDYYLQRHDLAFNQGEALAALAWLDRRHVTDRHVRHLPHWHAFSSRYGWRLERALDSFEVAMRQIQTLRTAVDQRLPSVTGTSK